MWRYLLGTAMVCLVVGLVICLALPTLAEGQLTRPRPDDEGDARIEFGEDNAPSQKDPSYNHGCTAICNYADGPCGWARVKSSKQNTSELCQMAQRYACRICNRYGKTPVTGCTTYNSW